ncbi:MAG: hypothetical protein J6T33_02285 [Bacteroidales bacterium]|nr:hypothetical protein [Bacteroidales bacterium]
MASVRYIVLAACQNAGLYAQAGWESEAAAWIEKQGSRQCAYVGYRRGQGVAGFDNVSVVFGGSDPRAALRRVRDNLERSLEFRSERQTEVDGFPALVMTARSKRRVYGVFGGSVRPTPPTPTENPMYFEAAEANSTVALMSMLETAPNLEYSTDGETWQEWQHTTADGIHTFDTITLTDVGDKVYFRGDNPDGLATALEGAEELLFSNFVFEGAVNGGGNVMSLLDKTMVLTEVPQLGFALLFAITGEGIEPALLTPPSMGSVTTIGEGGCVAMYINCKSLTAAANMPELTTIGINGCSSMYSGCTSLTAAANMPQLTTVGDYGCMAMYRSCLFNMSDDGTTLNFDFPTPPVTAGGTTYATAYDVADWMDNTNGFTEP